MYTEGPKYVFSIRERRVMEKLIALVLGIAALAVIIKFVYFPAVPEPMEYVSDNVTCALFLKCEHTEDMKVHLNLHGSITNKGKRDLSRISVSVPFSLLIQPGDKKVEKEITVDLGPLAHSEKKEIDQRIATEEVPERVNIGLDYKVDVKSAVY